MRAFSLALVQVILTQLILGCDQRQATSAVPTSAPSTTMPATAPAPAEPFSMTIDEHVYDFPPARLVVAVNDQKFSALLLTDDPPNAASQEYRGNSIYLQMTMHIPDTNTLAGAEWTFKTAEMERSEEIDGIYMQGNHRFLQPLDLSVKVINDTPPVKVLIQGAFLLFDDEDASDPPAEAKKVQVSGELPVRVQLKGEPASAQAH